MIELLGTMTGSEFLTAYFVWFVVLWGGVKILRRCGYDSALTTLGGLALFEGLGVLRFVIGSGQGMQRWGFLFLMMVVGALFFVIRAGAFGGGGGSSSSSCSAGGFIVGGTCGGGGSSDNGAGSSGDSSCGGGGCGGCGGS